MPIYHQLPPQGGMFALAKRTDGNEKYHLLPVANADYVVARFAIFAWAHTTAHQLISQAIEKYIKLILTIENKTFKKTHNHRFLLEKNINIELFDNILHNDRYMELIDALSHDKFISTRYGENYLSIKKPMLIDTLDRLVMDFLYAIPNGPKTVSVHQDMVSFFLRENKVFTKEHLVICKL